MVALTALPDGLRRLHAATIGPPLRRLGQTLARIRRDGFPRPRLVWDWPTRPPTRKSSAVWGPALRAGGVHGLTGGERPATQPGLARRRDIAPRLWGDGFLLPGGQAEAQRLAGLLPLSPATTLLLVGQDAGGAAEVIARTRGAWVASQLPCPVLVQRAKDHLRRLGRKATAEAWDPATTPRFRPRFHNHAIALEVLRGAAEPSGVIGAIAAALKPGGQLVMLEMVSDRPEACPPRWLTLEGRVRPLPTAATVEGWLRETGFVVHVAQDLSDRHAAQVVEGWSRLLGDVARGSERRDRDFAATLVTEAEAWLLRHRLLGAGIIGLRRWHASLAGPG